MKNRPLGLLTAFGIVVLLALLSGNGCSKHAPETAQTTVVSPPAPVPAPSPTPNPLSPPDPFVDVTAALANLSRDQASTVAPMLSGMNGAIDTQIAAWKAAGTANVSEAEEKVARARADFAQKVDALSFADDVAWKNVRSEAQYSLDNLRHAYRDLLAAAGKS